MDDPAIALELARAAAVVIRSASVDSVSYKDDASPVTDVDAAAEAVMLEMLADARPDDAAVAEESGLAGSSSRRWFIDPLDGTVNFINGIPQVSVSVGLWENDNPLAAAIVDVYRGEEFTAAAGRGAFLDGRPIAASQRTDLHPAVIATGFPYDHRDDPDRYADALRSVLAKVQGLRRLGSAALDLAWTAAGRFDGYYETGIAPWDIAAGLLLVTEAGGLATDFEGVAATPASKAIVCAGPGLHAELRQLVSQSF